MNRVAIFIDGGFLNKVLRREFNQARIDYSIFSQEIVRKIHSDADILRTYYYYCLPYQSSPPTKEESKRLSSTQKFLDAINRLSRFEVKLGRLARRGPDKDGRFFFEQKMVDALMSIDLVRLSAKGQISHAVIVAGDSDFVPAIETAKDEGVSIWLFHGSRTHNTLLSIADERIRIAQDLVDSALFKR